MNSDVIIFEQPLNEHIRACLRLEHLFSQLHHTIDLPSEWASANALQALLKILNVVDRPDLKTKITKALFNYAAMLTQLEKNPQVDTTILRGFLDQLDGTVDQLYALSQKMGQTLIDNEFIASVRTHMNSPGGPCHFNIPAYQLWLNQPPHQRASDLRRWHQEFSLIETAVTLLLQLSRQFTKGQTHIAYDGFYQQSLDATQQGDLVRVAIPSGQNLYPEISLGRHRLAVRFYYCNVFSRPQQANEPIEFKLILSALTPTTSRTNA